MPVFHSYKPYTTSPSYRASMVFILLFITVPLAADILRFPGYAPSIQETVDLAQDGDTVVVAEGHYFENIVIRQKAITLASPFILEGDSGHIPRTIIDGSRFTDSLRRSTISLIGCTDTTTVVKGLTITGGGGSPVYPGLAEHWSGGGIHIFESSGKAEDNIVESNHLRFGYRTNVGAGIMAAAAEGQVIVIRNNVIRNNTVETPMEAIGGGLWAGVGENGYLIIERNRIFQNQAKCTGPHQANGGGVRLLGMYPESAILVFRGNLVAYNQVITDPGDDDFKGAGGGVDIIYHDYPPESRILAPFLRVYNNRIIGNVASERGGGISLTEGNNGPHKHERVCPQVYLCNNFLTGNRAPFGAGIHNWNVSFIMVGNYLENDLSLEGSGEIFNEDFFILRNHGIINAHGNQVQGGWPEGRGIFREYPKVHSYSHHWKVTEENPETIQMRWIPPVWRQWWSLLLYLMGLVFIFWLYRQYLYRRFNLKAALEMEQKEKERIYRHDEFRSRFFSNISHEFRTPLTLISGPVEDVLKETYLKEKHRRNLEMVLRNVHRLQRLTSQLLELSKLESGRDKLTVMQGDLGAFVRNVASSFLSLAETRNMTYRMEIGPLPEETCFDSDKLEKIINNLLSNAFKFTPDRGTIECNLEFSCRKSSDSERFVTFRVKDSGRGMTEEQMNRVFERFYSEERVHGDDIEGSGIGMSLVKELVELYRGRIWVDSAPGEGTTFEVELPAVRSLFVRDEIIGKPVTTESQQDRKNHFGQETGITPETRQDQAIEKGSSLVLLVEDNNDMRNYLISHLSDRFQILGAENGLQALEIARDRIPDLVVSDLKMPEMDGMRLLEELRREERTSHIPFIMLTAQAEKVIRMESYRKGTDEHIEKPFDPEELKIRISGILNRQRELLEYFRNEFFKNPEVSIPSHYNDDFMKRLFRCIRSELSNPEFNVIALSEALHLSRVQLYRKVHAMTGFTPVDYIKNIRLKAAAKLLHESDLNVTQVMFEVGFVTPSHFAKSFRRKFGCNPSEYMLVHRKLPDSERGDP